MSTAPKAVETLSDDDARPPPAEVKVAAAPAAAPAAAAQVHLQLRLHLAAQAKGAARRAKAPTLQHKSQLQHDASCKATAKATAKAKANAKAKAKAVTPKRLAARDDHEDAGDGDEEEEEEEEEEDDDDEGDEKPALPAPNARKTVDMPNAPGTAPKGVGKKGDDASASTADRWYLMLYKGQGINGCYGIRDKQSGN